MGKKEYEQLLNYLEIYKYKKFDEVIKEASKHKKLKEFSAACSETGSIGKIKAEFDRLDDELEMLWKGCIRTDWSECLVFSPPENSVNINFKYINKKIDEFIAQKKSFIFKIEELLKKHHSLPGEINEKLCKMVIDEYEYVMELPKRKMQKSNVYYLNAVPQKTFEKIFSYLKYTDRQQCTTVNNRTITSSLLKSCNSPFFYYPNSKNCFVGFRSSSLQFPAPVDICLMDNYEYNSMGNEPIVLLVKSGNSISCYKCKNLGSWYSPAGYRYYADFVKLSPTDLYIFELQKQVQPEMLIFSENGFKVRLSE
jgi:hypothetical protein